MISSAPARAMRSTCSITRASGTGPSNGQPKDAPSVTLARTPAAWAAAIMLSCASAASASVVFWLRAQNVSESG